MYQNLYETNNRFKAYVDKYSAQNHCDLDTALKHKIVRNVGDMYEGMPDAKPAKVTMKAGCNGAQ